MKWLDRASGSKRLKVFWFLIFLVALGAFAARAPRLRMRPMHTDEAVHADKFGTLLESGTYEYNSREYHGPTLNYFTLIPAWLSGAHRYAQVTEVTLRIVPVTFSVILILLTVLLVDGLGPAAVAAAVLAALSPALFFYSRYYIQEMLLVCFTFGVIVCGYRYARTRALPWAVAAGICAGLMHATKETAVIALGCLFLAAVLVILPEVRRRRSVRPVLTGVKPLHLLAGLAPALGVSALFYSAFFTHPRGVLDSYLTYATYLGRAGGGSTMHVHPWHYYLQMLIFAHYGQGPIWTEGWIVLLAVVGLVAAIKGTHFGLLDPKLVRFLAYYTVALIVVYSALPYKTPWCVLSLLHGLILLAGVGTVALLVWVRKPAWRAAVVVLLVAAAGHLAFQAYRANFVYYADSRNPYVYSHPTPEIFTAVAKVREYAGLDGLGYSARTPIQVAVPGSDYWPLPWYLRDLRVRWCSSLQELDEIGPLILISDTLEGALAQRLYVETPPEKRQMYLYLFEPPYYIWARPGVKLVGFVRKDYWDQRALQPDPADLIKEKRDGQAPTTGNDVRNQ
jgi:uncharacterized protein (TIGR03663 family)